MSFFITHALFFAAMALGILAMPLSISDNPCDRVTCPEGKFCMAPEDLPKCFPLPIEGKSLPPLSVIETPHIRACPQDWACPQGQYCLEINGRPTCLQMSGPILDPCRFKICPSGEFCRVDGLLAKCSRLSIFSPTTTAAMTPPTTTTVSLTPEVSPRFDPCLVTTCDFGKTCEIVNGGPTCVPSDPVEGGPVFSDACAIITCADGFSCQDIGGLPRCIPDSPLILPPCGGMCTQPGLVCCNDVCRICKGILWGQASCTCSEVW